eukprot:gene14973-biopygen4114
MSRGGCSRRNRAGIEAADPHPMSSGLLPPYSYPRGLTTLTIPNPLPTGKRRVSMIRVETGREDHVDDGSTSHTRDQFMLAFPFLPTGIELESKLPSTPEDMWTAW